MQALFEDLTYSVDDMFTRLAAGERGDAATCGGAPSFPSKAGLHERRRSTNPASKSGPGVGHVGAHQHDEGAEVNPTPYTLHPALGPPHPKATSLIANPDPFLTLHSLNP